MGRHRSYSIEFKKQVVPSFLAGEATLHGLSKQHDISRNLIRLWITKFEAGEFDDEHVTVQMLAEYEGRIAALERMVGQLTMENSPLKKNISSISPTERRHALHCHRPEALSVRRGCELMALPRSTYYYRPRGGRGADEAKLIKAIEAICGEFPRYGYRRVTAQLRLDGWLVNHKRVIRIMREYELTVRPKRRYVHTTNSDLCLLQKRSYANATSRW